MQKCLHQKGLSMNVTNVDSDIKGTEVTGTGQYNNTPKECNESK